jgi:predicted GH43/DUF377 family glycosyl hydrolase
MDGEIGSEDAHGRAIWCLGAALHGLDDPANIIGISDQWILQPEDPWEVTGYVPNVVYSCGAIIHNNKLIIPYAMSDINSGIATVDVRELINSMHQSLIAI